MNTVKATKRETATTGQLNKLRESGQIPAILYGGKDPNANISIEKKVIKNFINSEAFFIFSFRIRFRWPKTKSYSKRSCLQCNF